MSLRDVLRILWLQKWIIGISVVVVLGGAGYYYSRSVPVFASSTTVRLDPALTGEPASNSSTILPPSVPLTAQTLTDPSVIASIAGRTGLSAGQVVSMLSASSSGAGMLTVVAQAHSPQQAQEVAAAAGPAVVAYEAGQFKAAVAELNASLNKINDNISGLNKRSAADPTNPLRTAQVNAAVAQYMSVFGEIAAAGAIAQPSSVLVEAGPGGLISTSKIVVFTGAILAGLLAGVGVALLRFWLDGRIVGADDVRAVVRAPLLGTLPRRPGRGNSDDLMAAATEADGSASVEAIRALRTAASALLLGPDRRVVVVTGVGHRVGATFVAANLAASFARSGHAAIIASGDVRNQDRNALAGSAEDQPAAVEGVDSDAVISPAISSGPEPTAALGTDSLLTRGPETRSLLSAPRGRDPLAAIKRTKVSNLWLLDSLVEPGQGTDALAGEGVQKLIAELRSMSNLVVLDTPPVLAVSDPLILAGYADAVIVVVRSRQTRSRALIKAIRRLEDAQVTHIGVVINGAKADFAH